MDLKITKFDPVQAPEGDLIQHHAIATAVHGLDFPERSVAPFDSYLGFLRASASAWGPRRFWVARLGERIVGTVILEFPDTENRSSAIALVRVPPELRSRGIGTALLGAALPDCRANSRNTIIGYGVKAGGDGEKWAQALGFAKVAEFVWQSLRITGTDPAHWQVAPPDGFCAERWTGAAPDELLAPLAHARTAIHDAPTNQSSLKSPNWTPERIRHHEAASRDRGAELRTVVARHRASGRVAGLTELEVRDGRPDTAYQLDTAVLSEFRGHGLGRFVKATMMRWLVAERPEVIHVITKTAADNTHMIRINHQLGYTTDHALVDLEASVDALQNRLCAQQNS